MFPCPTCLYLQANSNKIEYETFYFCWKNRIEETRMVNTKWVGDVLLDLAHICEGLLNTALQMLLLYLSQAKKLDTRVMSTPYTFKVQTECFET